MLTVQATGLINNATGDTVLLNVRMCSVPVMLYSMIQAADQIHRHLSNIDCLKVTVASTINELQSLSMPLTSEPQP